MKKRTQLVVLNKFQRWFIISFVGYTAAFLVIFAIGLFVWSKMLLQEILNVAGLLSSTFLSLLHKHLWMGLAVSILLIVVLLFVAGLQAIFFSRRIAGPIFALARHLEKCEREGKLKPFNLRHDDLFTDLAQKFNSLAESINAKGSK